MKEYRNIIVLGTTALLIGLALSIQVNMDESSNRGLISLTELKPYQEKLNQLTKEKESAKKDLIAIENKINKNENKKAEENNNMLFLVVSR